MRFLRLLLPFFVFCPFVNAQFPLLVQNWHGSGPAVADGQGHINIVPGYFGGNVLSVTAFGATGNGVTDDTAAIAAANAASTGALYFPPGTYLTSKTLALKNNTTYMGGNRLTSVIKYTGTGDALAALNPVNSATEAHIHIHDLGVTSTNAGATGADIDFVNGQLIHINDCYLAGNAYGVILDQSELVNVDTTDIEQCTTAGIWLVNGADHTPGAQTHFTNQINISNCNLSFDSYTTQVGVIDDGGAAHNFISDNFNGLETSMRLTGIQGGCIQTCEFDSWGSVAILTTLTSSVLGTVTNQILNVTIANCDFSPLNGNSIINFAGNGQNVILSGNIFNATSATKQLNVANVTNLVAIGNLDGGGGGALSSALGSNPYFVEDGATGIINDEAGLTGFGGAPNQAGSFGFTSFGGLTMRGQTGTNYDIGLENAAGNAYALGVITGTNFTVTPGGQVMAHYLVSTLPAAATYPYMVVFVTDATSAATTGQGSAPTGSGSVARPVYSNGSVWLQL